MAIVDEKKQQSENISAQESGCCGGASKEAVKQEEKIGETSNIQKLDLKSDKKEKEHGSSCCG